MEAKSNFRGYWRDVLMDLIGFIVRNDSVVSVLTVQKVVLTFYNPTETFWNKTHIYIIYIDVYHSKSCRFMTNKCIQVELLDFTELSWACSSQDTFEPGWLHHSEEKCAGFWLQWQGTEVFGLQHVCSSVELSDGDSKISISIERELDSGQGASKTWRKSTEFIFVHI